MSFLHRNGFTLVEVVMVLALVGIVTAVGLPRIGTVMQGSAMRSSKLEVKTALVLARTTAVQTGGFAQFIRTGNVIKVTSDSSGQQVRLVPDNDIYSEHKVALPVGTDTIRFDPRGFAFGISASPFYRVIRIQRGSLVDSICVTRFGRINSEGVCQ
ncbi:MAG: prepilin-type N-terminal cleavage/methylation domain-containing protein [Anaerolineae bacterium]|nr:prepilin-type N-terminal cleavage/methylation domain-containing protein [Gemmatimonadaceae bacterium]